MGCAKLAFSFLVIYKLGLVSVCARGVAVLVCDQQYWPHESDCSLYYQCAHGIGIVQSCPPPLLYDDRIMNCNWPYLVDCKSESNGTLTTPIKVTSTAADALTDGIEISSVEPSLPTSSPIQETTNTMSSTEAHAAESTAETPRPSPENKKKIICYFTNWSGYRNGIGQYTPDNIDPFLCTHIVYSFAILNKQTFKIELSDQWRDIDSKYIEKTITHKKANPNLKVLLAIGGWNDSEFPQYSELISDPKKRAVFCSHANELLEAHGFDGLDLDWEYPGFPQGNPGNPADSDNFAALVAELRQSLGSKLLSSAVAGNPRIAEKAYHPSIYQLLDWIGVMSYDYHGSWAGKTGYGAPLYTDANAPLSCDASVNFYLNHGCPPEKLVLGIPTYGHTFRLDDATNTGIGAAASAPGLPGPYTGVSGTMAYYEINNKIKENWTIVHNERLGSYAFSGNQWASFETPEMSKKKAAYVQQRELAGVMFWSLDMDTFQSEATSKSDSLHGAYDIIRASKNQLNTDLNQSHASNS